MTYLPKLKLIGRSTINKYFFKDGLRSPHMIFDLIGQVVSEKKMFESVDGRQTDGRRSH